VQARAGVFPDEVHRFKAREWDDLLAYVYGMEVE
jgi:hypothetical protein